MKDEGRILKHPGNEKVTSEEQEIVLSWSLVKEKVKDNSMFLFVPN